MESYEYIVVGAGIAGLNAALTIKNEDPQASLLLINGESSLPYKRTQLSKKLSQGYKAEDFSLLSFDAYRQKGIYLVQDWITQHEQDTRRLYGSKNRSYSYQKLILATGANYCYPKAWQSPFSLSLWNMADGLTLQQHSKESQTISILGAGVEGLELASAYAKTHRIQLFEQQATPLFRVSSQILQQRVIELLAAHNIEFYPKTTLKKVKKGSFSPLELQTEDASFTSDLLLIAAGTIPNHALLNGTEAYCDHYLQYAEHIFLAGDLCRYKSETGEVKRCHLWHEAESLGQCAGKNAVHSRTQKPLNAYQSKNYRTKIECFDEFFFLAQPTNADSEQAEEYKDEYGRYYQLWFENGALLGANMYGAEREKAAELNELIWEEAEATKVYEILGLTESMSIKNTLC